jgi:branched-subunit amino acid aminotransferase/4-amino-4-deoxychorismate lyase
MAIDKARTGGFHEAIRLNERGEVASACMANLFWLKGGKLFTPSLETGCLAGTTREFVLENLECEEVVTGIEAIQEADSIFLTSAGIGVVEVAEFDGNTKVVSGHAITSLLPQTT